MKIALIGLGIMGKNHYNELYKKDCELYLYDIVKPDWVKDNFYDNLDELLTKNIDGAIIATPTKYHFEVFSKIKNHIKYILIEKPLAFNLDEAKAICDFNNLVAVGFCERFNPVSLKFLELSKGEKINYASFIRASKKPDRISDVGVDMDLSVHDIDLANFFGIKADFTKTRLENTQIKLSSEKLEILASWQFHSRIRKAFINTDKSSYELDFLNSCIIKDEKIINIAKHSSLAREHEEFFKLIKTNDFGLLAKVEDAIYTQTSLI